MEKVKIGKQFSLNANNSIARITLLGETNQNDIPNPNHEVLINNITGDVNIEISDANNEHIQSFVFPLGSQKLMEGSYLANDGIHHKHKQFVIDGSEGIYGDTESGWSPFNFISRIPRYVTFSAYNILPSNAPNRSNIKAISTYFANIDESTQPSIIPANKITVQNLDLTLCYPDIQTASAEYIITWLSEHPTTVEYELQQEEIIPYTPEQREAWAELQNITLFEGINNFNGDAKLKVIYSSNEELKEENEIIYVEDKYGQLIAAFKKDDDDTLINPRISKTQNGDNIFTFSINMKNPKWEQIKNPENLYYADNMVFSTNFDNCFEERISENNEQIISITAYERQKLLTRKFVKAWNSETDVDIDTFMVVILSGGDLPLKNNGTLVNSTHAIGTSGYVLDGLLYGTGWTTGICDVEGIFDLETDQIDIYENIMKVQEIWGGILVFDSINKIVHHRNETTWLPYNGYEVKYQKNMQSLEKLYNNKIITKLCPLGEGGLNIKSVNNGSEWITNYTYTDTILEGIENNPDITEPSQLKAWGERKLLDLCKPCIELTVNSILLYQLEGYELETIDLNDIVDVINYNDIDGDIEQLRVISFEYGIWDKSDAILQLSDITLDSTDIFKKSVIATNMINEGTLNSTKVLTYIGSKQPLNKKLKNIDRTITDNYSELVQSDTEITARVVQMETDVDNLENTVVGQASIISELNIAVGEISTTVSETTREQNIRISTVEQTVSELDSKISNIEKFSNEIELEDKLHLEDTVDGIGYVMSFIIKGNSNIFYALTPEEELEPSEYLVPQGGDITIVVDKESSITEDAQYFNIEIGEPLRHNGNIYDEVNIWKDGTVKIIRRIDSSGYVMQSPVETVLEEKILLPTFDENTYLYIRDFRNVSYYCKYIMKSDYSEALALQSNLDNAVVELNSEIRQTESEINLEVSKKVGNNEIISKINQTAEEITIDSSKLNINGVISANGNFKVDTNGNLECNNAKLNGQYLKLEAGSYENPTFLIKNNNSNNLVNLSPEKLFIKKDGALLFNQVGTQTGLSVLYEDLQHNATANMSINNDDSALFSIQTSGNNSVNGFVDSSDARLAVSGPITTTRIGNSYSQGYITLERKNSAQQNEITSIVNDNTNQLYLKKDGNTTLIQPNGIWTPTLVQTSKESIKKNIFKYNENALETVLNSEIYTYNFKSENDTDKNHIGFVIGDEGGEYKTPDEVISNSGEGIDTYSMISILWKAVQEQQEQIEKQQETIENLQKQINELKGEN